jgi:hypothetical protein
MIGSMGDLRDAMKRLFRDIADHPGNLPTENRHTLQYS